MQALENPAVFEGGAAGAAQEALALEYLELVEVGGLGRYSARLGEAKQHVFTLCYAGLQVHTDLRGRMHKAREVDEIAQIVRELQARPCGLILTLVLPLPLPLPPTPPHHSPLHPIPHTTNTPPQ